MAVEHPVIYRTTFVIAFILLHLCFQIVSKGISDRCHIKFSKRMRGTVSSYDLNMTGISSMIAGNLMPRPLSILPSLISVTFLGHGKLSKGWMRLLFRVRRATIYEALNWLKNHNLKYYYEHIEINGT